MSEKGGIEAGARLKKAVTDPTWVRRSLVGIAIVWLLLLVVLPLVTVFVGAFEQGLGHYFKALLDEDTVSALGLTLVVALLSVPLNLIFGLAAAWAISKFEFPGKSFLLALIDVPYSVSPIVAGLLFVLLFGRNGWLGPFLEFVDVHIIFAVPGIDDGKEERLWFDSW